MSHKMKLAILLTICTIVNSNSIRMRGRELTESVNIKPIPCRQRNKETDHEYIRRCCFP